MFSFLRFLQIATRYVNKNPLTFSMLFHLTLDNPAAKVGTRGSIPTEIGLLTELVEFNIGKCVCCLVNMTKTSVCRVCCINASVSSLPLDSVASRLYLHRLYIRR